VVALAGRGRYIASDTNASSDSRFVMRAETQADVDAIKQSLGLLRRHL
jgi:hypothetical protein